MHTVRVNQEWCVYVWGVCVCVVCVFASVYKYTQSLAVVAHTFIPSTREAAAGGSL